ERSRAGARREECADGGGNGATDSAGPAERLAGCRIERQAAGSDVKSRSSINHDGAAVGDRRAGGHKESALVDGGNAGVVIGTANCKCARAGLGEATRAAVAHRGGQEAVVAARIEG